MIHIICYYLHNGLLLGCQKARQMAVLLFLTTQIDLEDIMLSEIRERQILNDFTYMKNLKKKKKEQTYNRNRLREQTDGCYRGQGWKRREIIEGNKVTQTFSYKINESQG